MLQQIRIGITDVSGDPASLPSSGFYCSPVWYIDIQAAKRNVSSKGLVQVDRPARQQKVGPENPFRCSNISRIIAWCSFTRYGNACLKLSLSNGAPSDIDRLSRGLFILKWVYMWAFVVGEWIDSATSQVWLFRLKTLTWNRDVLMRID